MFKFLSLFLSSAIAGSAAGVVLPPLANPSIHIGVKANFAATIPFTQHFGESHYIRNFVAPPVVALSEDWQWQCIVCDEIPSENAGTLKTQRKRSRTTLQATWQIRAGYRWANNRPVTGYDVEYTIQQIKAQVADSVERGLFPIEKVEVDADDPRRFTLTYREARSDFAQFLAISLLPSYLKQLDAQDVEKEEKKSSRATADLTATYFYYGPYLVQSVQDRKMTLAINPYSPTPAKVPLLQLMHYESPAYIVEQVLSGNLQMMEDGLLSPRQIQHSKELLERDKGLAGRAHLVYAAGTSLEQVVFNLRNPYLTNAKVRKALLYALNRNQIAKESLGAFATIAHHLVHEKDFYYPPPTKTYDHDTDTATKLLMESGWRKEESQKWLKKNGEELSFTLVTTKDAARAELFKAIEKNWADIGVRLKLETYDDEYFFKKMVRDAEFVDMALYSWEIPAGSLFWPNLHSKEIPSQENDYRGENAGGWFKKEVNQILDNLVITLDSNKRKELTAGLMKHYVLELPTLPLFFTPKAAIVPTKLKGFALPGHGYHSSLYAAEWSY